jgi:hypothetical protein
MHPLRANPETRPAAWGAADWLLLVAALVLGTANMPLRVVGWQFDHLPGDGIDNRLNNFILEHGYLYVTGRADSFWNAPAFFPAQGVTASTDAHLGLLPLYSAFRIAGVSPECAFQGWFIVPFFLNFAAALWALRRLGAGGAGAAAGALVFAFGLPVASQFCHAQLLPRFFAPPAVVFAWQYLRSAQTSRLALCCVCIVGQFYVSVYMACFLVMLLASGLLTASLLYRSQVRWVGLLHGNGAPWVARPAIVLTALLALLPLLWRHAHSAGSVGADYVRSLAPPPQGWMTPPRLALTNAFPTTPDAEQESRIFPGFAAWLALGVGLVSVPRARLLGGWPSAAATASWATLVLMCAVTAFDGFWLYGLVTELPGGCSLRAVGRIVLVLLFPLGIAVAAVVDALTARASRMSRPLGFAAGFVLLALIAADQWLVATDGAKAPLWAEQRTPRNWLVSRQDQLKDGISRHENPRVVFAFLNDQLSAERREPVHCVLVQLEAMRASQDLGIPCVNGYSGYLARDWQFFGDEAAMRTWLHSQGASPDVMAGLALVGVSPPGP